MNRLLSAFLLGITICSCKAANRNVNDFTLEKVSAVQIDESNVVLKTLPNSSVLLDDDHILSSVEYTRFVKYNLKTGKVETSFTIDSLMQNSNFNQQDYVRKNCEKAYPQRKYLRAEADKGSAPFKIFKLLANVTSSDSVVVLIGIFTPYQASLFYNGKTVDCIYGNYSYALATIDLKQQKLKSLYHINSHLFRHSGDTAQTVIPYIETGMLLDSDQLFMTLFPSPYDNELASFKLDSTNALEVCPTKYPKNTGEFSNNILYFNVIKDRSGNICYNSIYDIYNVSKLNAPELLVSLKGKLDSTKQERIHSFNRVDKDVFLIQTLFVETPIGGHMSFRIYNPETKQLGKSILNYDQTAILEYVLYTDNGFYKFTQKDENYYFEKYMLKYSPSAAH